MSEISELGRRLSALRAEIVASGTPLLTPEQVDAERGGYVDTLNRMHAAEARVTILEVELRALAQVNGENARLLARNAMLEAQLAQWRQHTGLLLVHGIQPPHAPQEMQSE